MALTKLKMPVIGNKLFFKDNDDDPESISKDALIWWNVTSSFLRQLISRAGFTPSQMESAMNFYYSYVVPNLGPAPTEDGLPRRWRSFMTDDFTPIEFSWAWGNADAIPVRRVRLSIEPISHEAGLASDPCNNATTCALAHQLGDIFSGVNLEWFDYLWQRMTAKISKAPYQPLPEHQASPTTAFLAFELGESEPLIKAYICSPERFQSAGTTAPSIILESLAAFAEETSWESLSSMIGFLRFKGEEMELQPFMIAFDCTTQDPRMKVYLRSPNTSYASVQTILRNFEEPGHIFNGLEELCELWKRVFCLEDNFDHCTQLPAQDHETAGILYYLEVRPNAEKITSKVYLPVKHYGTDDWKTTLALVRFFNSRHRIQSEIADQYLAALKAACTHRRLDQGRGMHTYIAATIKNNSLDITSYLSPEVYHANRCTNRT